MIEKREINRGNIYSHKTIKFEEAPGVVYPWKYYPDFDNYFDEDPEIETPTFYIDVEFLKCGSLNAELLKMQIEQGVLRGKIIFTPENSLEKVIVKEEVREKVAI